MKIKELIKILEETPDKEKVVCIPGNNNCATENIWYNFDDVWNVELYEIVNAIK